MTYYIQLIFEFVLTLFAIDFVSGFVHWAEDTFGTEQTPVYGKWIAVPNTIHHEQPAAFTQKNWWQSSWDLALCSALIALAAWWGSWLSWHVWVFCVLGANANQLHKYTHVPRAKIPLPVRWLQDLRVFQSAKDHALHHSGKKNTAYCVITPYLNPVLDSIGFWRCLEKIIVPFTGAPRREDLNTQPITSITDSPSEHYPLE